MVETNKAFAHFAWQSLRMRVVQRWSLIISLAVIAFLFFSYVLISPRITITDVHPSDYGDHVCISVKKYDFRELFIPGADSFFMIAALFVSTFKKIRLPFYVRFFHASKHWSYDRVDGRRGRKLKRIGVHLKPEMLQPSFDASESCCDDCEEFMWPKPTPAFAHFAW